jgi:hypothetical protein
MPSDQYKFQMATQDSNRHGRRLGENRASCNACPALGLMQFVYFWLAGKKHTG